MGLVGNIIGSLLGRKYRCKKCGNTFRGNKSSCPSCGHTVFEPVE